MLCCFPFPSYSIPHVMSFHESVCTYLFYAFFLTQQYTPPPAKKMQNCLLCYNTSRQFFLTSDGTWQDGFASRNKTGFHFFYSMTQKDAMKWMYVSKYSCSHNCSIKSKSINFSLLVYWPPQSYRNKKEMRCLFCYLLVIFLLNTISSHQ